MLTKTKYYTFKEVLAFFDINYDTNTDENWFLDVVSAEGYTLNLVGLKLDSTIIPSSQMNEIINRVVQIVFDRHSEDYIARIKHPYFENEDEDEDLAKASYEALKRLINVVNLTAPKYIPIFVNYYNNYEEPLKKLESESDSFNRYNDTPQNAQDILDFNVEDYATNMGRNKSITKVDADNLVNLIKNLQENWKSVILEWSNEFNQLFIDEMQIGE